MKLNVKAFGLASGIFWGIGVFALAWWLIIFEGSSGDPTFIGRSYKGFSISPFGSVIGLIWGFFDGLMAVFVFAWLYNKLASYFKI